MGAYPELERALSEGPLTADRLSATLGKSTAWLAHVRAGHYVLDPDIKSRIAAALGVPEADLFRRDPDTTRALATADGPAPDSQFRQVRSATARRSAS